MNTRPRNPPKPTLVRGKKPRRKKFNETMANFRLYVNGFLEHEEAQRLGMPRRWDEGYYEFSNVNALEPTMWLPIAGIKAIKDKITKVTVLLEEDWSSREFQEDGERYCLGSANCIVQRFEQHIGGVHAYVRHKSQLQISGTTLQSVFELIFAMKQGKAVKVGDMSFAHYANQRSIPYTALRKSFKQRLQDWWKKVKIGFLNYVKPLPIPRDVVND